MVGRSVVDGFDRPASHARPDMSLDCRPYAGSPRLLFISLEPSGRII